ncbi:hypothetical protein [Azohydromonas aeria]|uniref:hypothetical protein n=1 Tax=Azohydromonas aeria TaxID=2590212 RepID=UPI0012F81510|nr:hypothetical protein [Azohydromonas aeria]
MKLHIITVVYQDGDDLAATYESCHSHGHSPLNMVHWIFIKKYHDELQTKYPRSQVFHSNDRGIYNAMNLAFGHISSSLQDNDVVLFLNAGDKIEGRELAAHLQHHVREQADVSVAAVTLLRHEVPLSKRLPPNPDTTLGAIIYRQFPCHQSTFYAAKLLKKVWNQRGCLYREEFNVCGDLELYLAVQRSKVVATDLATSAYDVDGYSSKQALVVAREKKRLARMYRVGAWWRCYSTYWHFKARLVAPKRLVLRLLRRA